MLRATVDAGTDDLRFPQACQSADARIWVVYEQISERGSRVALSEITKDGDRPR
jgi:hypothetical protein